MTQILFLAKKVIGSLLSPLGMGVVLLIGGIILWVRGYRRLGYSILICCASWLILMSLPVVAHFLMRPLETDAGPYADPEVLRQRGVCYIIVLASGSLDSTLSPADRLGSGLFRFMEGFRLWCQLPESNLVLSGAGFPPGRTPEALMRELPQALGIPQNRLILENRAWDTEDEAALLSRSANGKPFALVTSAYHMPRAIRHFKRFGTDPIRAPCEFTSSESFIFYDRFVPSPWALGQNHLAVHEYLGMAWLFIKETYEKVFKGNSAANLGPLSDLV